MRISQQGEYIRKAESFSRIWETVRDLREGRDRNATRNAKFFKQVDMAEIFGMPAQNWNKIEKGKINGGNNPTIEHLIGMSVFWGVSIDYLVTREHPSILKGPDELEAASVDRVKLLEEKLADKEETISAQRETIDALKMRINELSGV